MIAFGNVGFKYFDKHRKFWMGLAMWSTFLSMSFTVAGCFALSTNKQIVMNTNWVYIEGVDTVSVPSLSLFSSLIPRTTS
jgi:hypothetical protein